MLEEKREHTKVLPGVKIPYDIKFTTDMKDACQDADLIVVLDQGVVVEMGNHKELLEKQGVYNRLYQTQFAGLDT